MNGICGKILVIDVSRKESTLIEKDAAYFRKHPGGALLAAALYEEWIQDANGIDAFAPDNPIIFATGPLAGGNVCGATRVNILSRAPESTGIYLSQAGGEFGPALKRAGVDALVISGMADVPVIIDINNDKVEFTDAGSYWGMDRVAVTEQLIDQKGRDYCIASIGPAGENRVRFANIMFEPDHYAGRGGLGAVLGAKHVKAVAVRGNQPVTFKDPDTIKEINKKGAAKFSKILKKAPGSFLGVLRRLGTFGLLDMNLKTGNLPTRNFTLGCPDEDSGEHIKYQHDVVEAEFAGRVNPCKNCFVACKKQSKAHPGHSALPEYESAAILGPNIGLEKDTDLDTCLEICEMCNRLGLDSISTGNMVAWLMNCFEKKVIKKEALDYEIAFGDGEKTIDLIKNIAFRKDAVGNLLADGIDAAIRKLGPEARPYSRFVNGVGMPAHMPRNKPGIGFAYHHGPNPNDHMKLEHDWIAAHPGSLKMFNLEKTSEPGALDPAKIDAARATQTYYAAMDTLSLCMFIFGPGNLYSFDDIKEMVNAATGFDYTFEDLMTIGARAILLQRRLFLRLGEKTPTFYRIWKKRSRQARPKGLKSAKTTSLPPGNTIIKSPAGMKTGCPRRRRQKL